MKDYPDRMTPEQAQAFRDDVLNIVSQIPRGCVTTYGHVDMQKHLWGHLDAFFRDE